MYICTHIYICMYMCIYIHTHRFINNEHFKLVSSHYQALLNNDVITLNFHMKVRNPSFINSIYLSFPMYSFLVL